MAAAALAACGGGGGSDPGTGTGGPAPAAITISGTAATGAAFTEGTITVLDSRGVQVGSSSSIGSDGSYSVTLASGATAPFVLIASRITANGETESLVSVAATDSVTRVNVTPVTSLIAARLAPSGDPLTLASALQADATLVTPDKVATTIAEVNTVLAPILAATSTSTTIDPIGTTIRTDGTGYDRLLDSIKVSITPAGASSNIEVGFKVQQADATAQPPVVQFTSNADTGTLSSAAGGVTLNAASLVPSGTSALIQDFLASLTACYALPLETRVANATALDNAVTGSAADVSAPACRNVFAGNDPAAYLSNASRVGRDANNNGAFSSLFRRGATGLVFSQGSYEFSRANGDLVVGYKSRDSTGAETFDSMVVRKDPADGKLRLIGNQYAYPGGVVAYHQARQFVTLDQSAFNYLSTGYDLRVANLVDSQGAPSFDRVEVTTPRGTVLTLKPSAGAGNLNLVRAGVVSGTSYLRIRSAYDDRTNPAHPGARDTGLFFAATNATEGEVAAIPAQSVWTFRYFLAGNTSATPDAVQAYKTRARALTLGELGQRSLATLSPTDLADMVARSDANTGNVSLPTDGPAGPIHHVVPAGALPPTSAKLFGSLRDPVTGLRTGGFDDARSMASNATQFTIPCVKATAADAHCSGTVAGAFAANAWASGLHLLARDTAGREYARFYAMYRLN